MRNHGTATHQRSRAFAPTLFVVVVGLMGGTAQSQTPAAPAQPVINYARIDLVQASINHKVSEDTKEESSITGVYANYSPVESCQGVLVVADPFDGCGQLNRPEGMPTSTSIVFLARLNANSTCTAVEQNQNARAAGARGIINMAPDPSTNYIWILQGTPRDESKNGVIDGGAVRMIPHVAVSGVSGTRLYARLIEAPGTVIIDSQKDEQEEGIMVMDLAITIVCITVAVLVLMYAYRVGRSICINEEVFFLAESIPDPEQTAQLRARVSAILISDIPVVKYNKDEMEKGQDDTESSEGIDCAVCLDTLDEGDEVRKLSCNHLFHKECIDPWLLDHHNCPLCKDDICAPRHLTERRESVGSNDFMMDMTEMATGGSDGVVNGMVEVNLNLDEYVVVNGTNVRDGNPNSYEWEWSSTGAGSEVSHVDVEEARSATSRDGVSLEAYGSECDVDMPTSSVAAGPPGSVHRWGSEHGGSSQSLISGNGSSNSLVDGVAYSPESGYRRHNAV